MERNEQLALEYLKILAEKGLLDFNKVGHQQTIVLHVNGDVWHCRALEQNVKLLHATYGKILELISSDEGSKSDD